MEFLKLLFSTWLAKIGVFLTILSFVGFFIPTITVPGWAPWSFMLLGLISSCHEIYIRQRNEINRLKLQFPKPRSELLIYMLPQNSRAILNADHNDRNHLLGCFLEFHLAIENKGDRTSNINYCELRIKETDKTHKDIKPIYKSGIQGRTTFYSMDTSRWLLEGGALTLDAYKMTPEKIILFYVKELLPMDCRSIHCTLILRDTENNSVSADFELQVQ